VHLKEGWIDSGSTAAALRVRIGGVTGMGKKCQFCMYICSFHGSEAALHCQFWGKDYLAESVAEGQFFCT
jgi:hypothetical protein